MEPEIGNLGEIENRPISDFRREANPFDERLEIGRFRLKLNFHENGGSIFSPIMTAVNWNDLSTCVALV